MTRSRLPTVIAIIAAVVTTGYLAWQLRAERLAVVQLRDRAAALELVLRNAPVPAPPLVVGQPESPAVATPAITPAPLPVVAPAPAPAPVMPKSGIIVMRADGTPDPDPNAGARFQLLLVYGDIQKELGLSAEQMDALIRLTARGDATPAELEALLGAKYPQLQELARSNDVQRTVTNLRTGLASSAHPLTEQQGERLGSEMLAEARRRDEELGVRPKATDPSAQLDYDERRIKVTEAGNERLIAAARTFLEPEQIAVMQGSATMLLNAQRRNVEARRAQLAAGGTGAPEPAAPIYVFPAGTRGGPGAPMPVTTPPR